jgi:predicted nucleotidyltransferase
MQLPGNKTHQKILQLLVKLFQNDKNIQAFIIFGSLVRGNWDKYSDLDLDAIVNSTDNEMVQVEMKQVINILSSSGFTILTSFEEFPNEIVVILESLDRISIRFHLLKDTNRSILDSMQILCGTLTKEEIIKSTIQKEKNTNPELLSNKFLELAIYVPVSIKRNNLMNAYFFVNKMRQIIIQIYINSHGIKREFDFENNADIYLVNDLKKTYGNCTNQEIKQSFILLLNIFEQKIDKISAGKFVLTKNQLILLQKVKYF